MGKCKKYFAYVYRKNFRKRVYFGKSLKTVLELGNVFHRWSVNCKKNVRKGLEKVERSFWENLKNISGNVKWILEIVATFLEKLENIG